MYRKEVMCLEGMVTRVHCKGGRGGQWEEEGGGHLWKEGDDYRNYRGEELLDGDGKWCRGRRGWRIREHTMELVLDDLVRVLEGLVLRRNGIGGMKELIDSILHDWPVDGLRRLGSALITFHPPSRALPSLSSLQWRQSCTSTSLSFLHPPLLTIKRKSLKVADLKEICTRANVPTTTRSTKADLITKILASQPAIDAYNAKYQHNGNAVPSSKPAALSTHNDSVSGNASS